MLLRTTNKIIMQTKITITISRNNNTTKTKTLTFNKVLSFEEIKSCCKWYNKIMPLTNAYATVHDEHGLYTALYNNRSLLKK